MDKAMKRHKGVVKAEATSKRNGGTTVFATCQKASNAEPIV